MKGTRDAFSLVEALAALAVLALLASSLVFLWSRHLNAIRESEAVLEGTLLLQSAHAGLMVRRDPKWPDPPPSKETWIWNTAGADSEWNVWTLHPASNENPRLQWPYRISLSVSGKTEVPDRD